MKVKELIQHLKQFSQEAEVLVSSDEELNTLYKMFEVAELTNNEEEDDDNDQIVIYGLSGHEVE
jgi:hypothetical protein